MKNNLLSTDINRSIAEVFQFTVNPQKTHLWIPSVSKEIIDTISPWVGTIYTNDSGSYLCVEFVENTKFHLKSINSSYEVVYFYNPIDGNRTIMTYYEFMNDWSDLLDPFSEDPIHTLKRLLEK